MFQSRDHAGARDYQNDRTKARDQYWQSATNHRRGNTGVNQSEKSRKYSDAVKSKKSSHSGNMRQEQGYQFDYAVPTYNSFNPLN